jgi:hypothetical protein
MEIHTLNKNRDPIRTNPNQRLVGLTKRTVLIQKLTLYKSIITPQMKFGRTDDEILNNVIAELYTSINKSNFN